MKYQIFKNLLKFVQLLLIIGILYENSNSQQTGIFDKTIEMGTITRDVSFYVPGGPPSKRFPLIIGLHPAQTPASAMRQLLQGSAESLGAILACPEGPDGDGLAIMPLVDWIKKTYKVDSTKVILTGYSAGGYPTFQVGLSNTSTFKGLIGIAPSVSTYGINMNSVSELGIAIIVGKSDGMYSGIKDFINAVNAKGGITKFIEKNGVGHTGQYFWSQEFVTDWNECYDFCINTSPKPKKTTLSKPDNYAEDQPVQITFSWIAVQGATSYKIEVNSAGGYSRTETVTKTSYNLNGLQKNTQYSWKVCGVNASGDGAWSDNWVFTTIADPPKTAALLLEPLNNAEISALEGIFIWQTVTDASKYHFQLYDNESSELLFEDSTLTSTGNTVETEVYTLLPDKQYMWKVRAYNSSGSAPWSEERMFKTLPLPPENPPELQEPADNTTNLPLAVTFKWGLVEDADKYQLMIRKKTDYTVIYNDSNIAKPASGDNIETTAGGLEKGTSYLWKVRGLNKGGNGTWSYEYHFTTGTDVSVNYEAIEYFKAELFPNPSQGLSILRFEIPEQANVRIEIFNLLGECSNKIYEAANQSGKKTQLLDFSTYSPGFYYLKIISGNHSGIIGFVIE
ncbi:MAG: large repetitive protein [Bacteroidota bacterium]|nr:large repetitive protein [Bacteroidota bacterium]